jgi:hypothetical protein
MGNGPITTVSAMVMIASASGTVPDPRHPPTAATVAQHAPRPQALERARKSLGEAGFQLGQPVGGTFAITGSSTLFERFFGVHLHPDGRGSVTVAETATYEVPADHIPPTLRDVVQIVTFSAPPDFGPGNP